VLVALTQRAARVGLLKGLGAERGAQRVLVLLLARVAPQGARLAAVPWATQHAGAETLGAKPWAEEALSAALDRRANHQARLADALSRSTGRQRGRAPTGGLSAVPAAALAGAQQALAALGERRAKKPGTAPIVLGLWPTAEGEPWAGPV
jgi:hypothetical protein